MGKFDFEVPTSWFNKIESLYDADKIAKKILKSTVPILKKAVKAESAKHNRTNDMTDSIDYTNVRHNEWGYYITVRPTGVDSKGVRNMDKMAHAEYGTSKQEATPILSKAVNDSKEECLNKMQQTYNEIFGGG